MKHELKIWPQYFEQVASGNKTYEVRKNDRNFFPGDTVVLKEFDISTEKYSGRSLEFKIGYMMPADMDTSLVVFSLLPKATP